jgi:hypothetical protein
VRDNGLPVCHLRAMNDQQNLTTKMAAWTHGQCPARTECLPLKEISQQSYWPKPSPLA